jgi:signal transduction histidine kinase/CheY-like chemotaxis protein
MPSAPHERSIGHEHDRDSVAGALRAFVYVTVPLTVVFSFVYAWSEPELAARVAVQCAVFATIGLLGLYLSRVGRVQLASWLVVSMCFVTIAASAYTRSGVRGPAYPSLSAIIVLAGVLLGGSAGAAVTLGSIALGGVLVWLELGGHLPVPRAPNTSLSLWLACSLVFGTVATLQHLFARIARASLERARAEDERRRLADEARAQAEGRTRAAQRMETIGHFAGGVAHDFNNALVVIMSWVDLLRRPDLPDHKREEGLSAISTSANRAAQLTRQLMSIGRRDVRAPRPTSLAHVVDETMGAVSRLLPSDVRVEIAHETPALVLADEAQLHQLLLNLALNARDAMPAGGTLRIRTRLAPPDAGTDLPHADSGYVELSMKDSGTGMDEATRARIFEPFFTTKAESHGTGLGLATVHAIATDSQGTVTVESEPGRGSCFRVYLPVAEGAAAATRAPAPESVPRANGLVLVVDDEAPVRRVMGELLRDAGYEVLLAEDGDRALGLARRSRAPIDLLCTDGILPGLRTDALIMQYRELFPRGRVLVCSGHVQEELLRRRIAEGECAFLQKPFAAEELLRVVAELTTG